MSDEGWGRAKRKARGLGLSWDLFIKQVSGGKTSGQNQPIEA